jgi:hypothetical protein
VPRKPSQRQKHKHGQGSGRPRSPFQGTEESHHNSPIDIPAPTSTAGGECSEQRFWVRRRCQEEEEEWQGDEAAMSAGCDKGHDDVGAAVTGQEE